jgi:hypothetical protein
LLSIKYRLRLPTAPEKHQREPNASAFMILITNKLRKIKVPKIHMYGILEIKNAPEIAAV